MPLLVLPTMTVKSKSASSQPLRSCTYGFNLKILSFQKTWPLTLSMMSRSLKFRLVFFRCTYNMNFLHRLIHTIGCLCHLPGRALKTPRLTFMAEGWKWERDSNNMTQTQVVSMFKKIKTTRFLDLYSLNHQTDLSTQLLFLFLTVIYVLKSFTV